VNASFSGLLTPAASLWSHGRDIVERGELSPVSAHQAAQLLLDLRQERLQVANQISQLEMEIRSQRSQSGSSKATGSTASESTVQHMSPPYAKQQGSERTEHIHSEEMHNRDFESESRSSQHDSGTRYDQYQVTRSQQGEQIQYFSSTPVDVSYRHRHIKQVYNNVSRIHDSIDERVSDIKERCQQLLSRQSQVEWWSNGVPIEPT